MLVITRRRDEAVVIGDGIEVRVLRIGREGVRLGITAPLQVRIHRREIYDLIRDQNRSAAQSRPAPRALIEQVRRAHPGGEPAASGGTPRHGAAREAC